MARQTRPKLPPRPKGRLRLSQLKKSGWPPRRPRRSARPKLPPRPLEARPERDGGLIWFVTDVRSGKEHEIEAEHDVCLVFIDAEAKAYLSITARAEVLHDHAKAAEIWKSTDTMWWSGPDDPNVCVLRVRPVTAELWDGPSSAAVAAFEFAKARITGAKPNLGENRKVTVKM
jgi:general stress protein 26